MNYLLLMGLVLLSGFHGIVKLYGGFVLHFLKFLNFFGVNGGGGFSYGFRKSWLLW